MFASVPPCFPKTMSRHGVRKNVSMRTSEYDLVCAVRCARARASEPAAIIPGVLCHDLRLEENVWICIRECVLVCAVSSVQRQVLASVPPLFPENDERMMSCHEIRRECLGLHPRVCSSLRGYMLASVPPCLQERMMSCHEVGRECLGLHPRVCSSVQGHMLASVPPCLQKRMMSYHEVWEGMSGFASERVLKCARARAGERATTLAGQCRARVVLDVPSRERGRACGGRSWDLDPTVRHTFWTMSVGGATFWLQTSGVNQNMMQRYLALPTRGRARASVWIFVLGALFLIFTCCYSGLLIYATYYDCDPLTTKLAAAKDQLLPLLVMRTLGQWPGLPGCFVAGVFSAALSSMSTAMNSMAAVVLEDFYKTFFAKKPLTDRQTNVLMKTVVVVTGVVCVSLVFVVEKLGSILQLSMSLGAMTNGPALGIFSMGLFLPWVNNKGMLAGSCAGLLVMGWIVLGAQAAIATGDMAFPTKPFSVQGCTYSFAAHAVNATLAPAHAHADASSDVFPLYRVSYLWYTLLGVVVSTAVALPVSFLTGANRPQDVDARLLSPVVRRFFRARSAPAASPAPAANGYKSVELHIIPNSQSAEEKEKEAMLES